VTVTKTAGGRFDPDDRHRYFYAANPHSLVQSWIRLGRPTGMRMLVAVNDLQGKASRDYLDTLIEGGCRILLDSGIFWLTNEHKRAHGITMDEALALPTSAIDGFEDLMALYLELTTAYGPDLWGYIELDLGGPDGKRATRRMLHDRGLSPIPVYHPLGDGPEYIHELAEGYDRVCFGNVVQANEQARKRLMATAWHLHRQYPDLWIHLLGYTPDQKLLAFPGAADSCDSSSWLTAMRWSAAWREKAMGRSITGGMRPEFVYRLGDVEQRNTMLAACVQEFAAVEATWQDWTSEINDAIGASWLPPLPTP
jgi:hypothetical protein